MLHISQRCLLSVDIQYELVYSSFLIVIKDQTIIYCNIIKLDARIFEYLNALRAEKSTCLIKFDKIVEFG